MSDKQYILWLSHQLWVWILFGILLFYIFFYIAKGFIVLFGGIILGLYLYNIFVLKKENNSVFDTIITKSKDIIYKNKLFMNK